MTKGLILLLHTKRKPSNMRQLNENAPRPPISPPAAPAPPRLRLGKLCVAIQGSSPAELLDRAEAALKDFKFHRVPARLSGQAGHAVPYLKQFLAEHRDVTAIATCRRKPHGGDFDGPLAAQLEILAKAAQAGCQIVDLEIESAEEAKAAQRWPTARRRRSAAHQFSRLYAHQAASNRRPIASRPSSPISSKSSRPPAPWPTISPCCG